ncbi:T9SS type A sorting domain-containing protein [candidate division KSB1 bacterium]|nr:T9SS type A sorting domain-containing protein [candidate division KSB1 bacterium]
MNKKISKSLFIVFSAACYSLIQSSTPKLASPSITKIENEKMWHVKASIALDSNESCAFWGDGEILRSYSFDDKILTSTVLGSQINDIEATKNVIFIATEKNGIYQYQPANNTLNPIPGCISGAVSVLAEHEGSIYFVSGHNLYKLQNVDSTSPFDLGILDYGFYPTDIDIYEGEYERETTNFVILSSKQITDNDSTPKTGIFEIFRTFSEDEALKCQTYSISTAQINFDIYNFSIYSVSGILNSNWVGTTPDRNPNPCNANFQIDNSLKGKFYDICFHEQAKYLFLAGSDGITIKPAPKSNATISSVYKKDGYFDLVALSQKNSKSDTFQVAAVKIADKIFRYYKIVVKDEITVAKADSIDYRTVPHSVVSIKKDSVYLANGRGGIKIYDNELNLKRQIDVPKDTDESINFSTTSQNMLYFASNNTVYGGYREGQINLSVFRKNKFDEHIFTSIDRIIANEKFLFIKEKDHLYSYDIENNKDVGSLSFKINDLSIKSFAEDSVYISNNEGIFRFDNSLSLDDSTVICSYDSIQHIAVDGDYILFSKSNNSVYLFSLIDNAIVDVIDFQFISIKDLSMRGLFAYIADTLAVYTYDLLHKGNPQLIGSLPIPNSSYIYSSNRHGNVLGCTNNCLWSFPNDKALKQEIAQPTLTFLENTPTGGFVRDKLQLTVMPNRLRKHESLSVENLISINSLFSAQNPNFLTEITLDKQGTASAYATVRAEPSQQTANSDTLSFEIGNLGLSLSGSLNSQQFPTIYVENKAPITGTVTSQYEINHYKSDQETVLMRIFDWKDSDRSSPLKSFQNDATLSYDDNYCSQGAITLPEACDSSYIAYLICEKEYQNDIENVEFSNLFDSEFQQINEQGYLNYAIDSTKTIPIRAIQLIKLIHNLPGPERAMGDTLIFTDYCSSFSTQWDLSADFMQFYFDFGDGENSGWINDSVSCHPYAGESIINYVKVKGRYKSQADNDWHEVGSNDSVRVYVGSIELNLNSVKFNQDSIIDIHDRPSLDIVSNSKFSLTFELEWNNKFSQLPETHQAILASTDGSDIHKNLKQSNSNTKLYIDNYEINQDFTSKAAKKYIWFFSDVIDFTDTNLAFKQLMFRESIPDSLDFDNISNLVTNDFSAFDSLYENYIPNFIWWWDDIKTYVIDSRQIQAFEISIHKIPDISGTFKKDESDDLVYVFEPNSNYRCGLEHELIYWIKADTASDSLWKKMNDNNLKIRYSASGIYHPQVYACCKVFTSAKSNIFFADPIIIEPDVDNITIPDTLETSLGHYKVSIETDSHLRPIFHARIPGNSQYHAMELLNENNSRLHERNVPSDLISSSGLEAYIEILDQDGEYICLADLGIDSLKPKSILALFETMDSTLCIAPNKYCPISFPFLPSDSNFNDVYKGVSVKSDNKDKVRVFTYSENDFKEFDKYSDAFKFRPGMAYWIISKDQKSIKSGAGISLDTSTPFPLTLSDKWNFISNPFTFPISINDLISVQDAEDIEPVLWQWSLDRGGYIASESFDPFTGYFIYCKNKTAQLKVPSTRDLRKTVVTEISLPRMLESEINDDAKEWYLTIKASSENYSDEFNYLGHIENTSPLSMFNYLHEPPYPDNFISLYLKEETGNFTTSFKNLSSEIEESWYITVRHKAPKETVTLSVCEEMPLPANIYYKIYPLEVEPHNDHFTDSTYSFVCTDALFQREFILKVGIKDFVDILPDQLKPAKEVELENNYPNPFNSKTTFSFSIPAQSNVELIITDLLGREVYKYSSFLDAGKHKLVWAGVDKNDKKLSSGLYLYRLKVGKIAKTGKVVFVK